MEDFMMMMMMMMMIMIMMMMIMMMMIMMEMDGISETGEFQILLKTHFAAKGDVVVMLSVDPKKVAECI